MTARLLLVLDLVIVALAALQVWEVAEVTRARLAYGYDLEWMEGATLVTGLRARDGLPFYTEPGPDYIPFIYPPLYAWVLGALGQVFPFGYALARSVSVVGTLAGAAAVAFAVRATGARWAWAVGAAGLFVGAYEDGGTFYDLVRIDGLSIALLGWALAVAAGRGRRAAVVGGLLLAVAFMAKHHAAIFGFPIALVRWRREGWRDALAFGLAALLPALAFTVAMQVHTGGLFLTYLLEVPAHHGMVADRIVPAIDLSLSPFRYRGSGAAVECLEAMPLTTLAALALPMWMRREGGYWAWVALVALVTVTLMRGHTGGFLNVLIPMFWVQAVVAAAWGEAVGDRWAWARPAAAVLLAAQLWQGRGALERYAPDAEDAAVMAKVVEDLRTLPEPLLIPHSPYLAVLAGKAPSFSLIALWDLNHEGGPLRSGVREVERAMRQGYWKAVVVPDEKLGYGLRDGYRKWRGLREISPGMKTGWPVRLRQVWVPKGEGAEGG